MKIIAKPKSSRYWNAEVKDCKSQEVISSGLFLSTTAQFEVISENAAEMVLRHNEDNYEFAVDFILFHRWFTKQKVLI